MEIQELENCLVGLRQTIEAMGYVNVQCHYDIKADESNLLWVYMHLPFKKPKTLDFKESIYRRHDPNQDVSAFLSDIVAEISADYGRASSWQMKVVMTALSEAREVCKSAVVDDQLQKMLNDVEATMASEMVRINKNALDGVS